MIKVALGVAAVLTVIYFPGTVGQLVLAATVLVVASFMNQVPR